MEDFSIGEMLEMQKALQKKYKDIWRPVCPDRGKDQLLWMIGEIGEVIDIVKKNGGEKASRDDELRKQLIEELADAAVEIFASEENNREQRREKRKKREEKAEKKE